MMDNGRSRGGPANQKKDVKDDAMDFRSRRGKELDEELRMQLRKKNEENRKHIIDKSEDKECDKIR